MAEGTQFSAIYNRFLGKITDDLYIELTPEDTIRDLRQLLLDALPGFEFPRVDLYDYEIKQEIIQEDEVVEGDFVLGIIWNDDPVNNQEKIPMALIERSAFSAQLSPEEINILAILMKQGWVQRQVTSIENTRMKFSGSDFKFTSQANHLRKLMTLLEESRRDSFHMQRLYKRRKKDEDGRYVSNWSILRSKRDGR